MHLTGPLLAGGCCGIIKEGTFGGLPAALKFYVPGLAQSPAIAAASLEAELQAYAALDDIQGADKA